MTQEQSATKCCSMTDAPVAKATCTTGGQECPAPHFTITMLGTAMTSALASPAKSQLGYHDPPSASQSTILLL